MDVVIREAAEGELETVLAVERAAFGAEDVAGLVRDLAGDPTARPVLSLLAFANGMATGHIMFTKAGIEPESGLSLAILAPLAVVPEHQRRGIGGKLIEAGLKILADGGVDLVFVLGYPEYYQRHGFRPARHFGLHAPYPIPEEVADAWMVRELRPGRLGNCSGTVICAAAMDKPEHWRE